MRIGTFALYILLAGLACVLATAESANADILPPASGILDNFADTTDLWGNTIVVGTNWNLDTANGALQKTAVGDSVTGTTGYNQGGGSKPAAVEWLDVSGWTGFSFTVKNTGSSSQTWQYYQNGLNISVKRYTTAGSNSVTALSYGLPSLLIAAKGSATLAAGEEVTVSVLFDDFDYKDRNELGGWDGTTRLMSGWQFHTQNSGANAPIEFSNLRLTPIPVPEPATLGLLVSAAFPLLLRRWRNG